MVDLKSDIVGLIERLPLKPSEETSLFPLFEAISNSIHAIDERYGEKEATKIGKIKIEVLRQKTDTEERKVSGFIISDNGIGLNDDNFESFCKPYTQKKIAKGGKGVGRLSWLKVFKSIKIYSSFIDNENLKSRRFQFFLRDQNQIELLNSSNAPFLGCGTQVILTDFNDIFGNRCPLNQNTIIQRIIGHFLPLFAGDKCPEILFIDDETSDLQHEFKNRIKSKKDEFIDVEIDGQKQPFLIQHMRCETSIRPRSNNYNWICFCANDRGVKEFGIDEQIGIKRLENDEIYIGTISSDFLDSHVNPQRTGFIFEAEDAKGIRRQVVDSIKLFLQNEVEKSLSEKKRITLDIIKKNPQYIYLHEEIDEFVLKLKPNSAKEEDIFLEMSQNKYRRQKRFNGIYNEIKKSPEYNSAIAEKILEYKKFLQSDKTGALAEYVIRRKSVLDLLDKYRGTDPDTYGKNFLEEAIHQLICPMRYDSHQMTLDDHNLWILDDRLAFFNFFASDKPLKSYTGSSSSREPDLAIFYDQCLAWRESDRSCDTIILVEFKRPGLNSYDDSNDPFIQLMEYVNLFKSGATVKDKSGKIISGIGSNTAFHCYIVADLTEGLKKRIRGRFQSTPDNKGRFGYTTEPDAYLEIISYDKLFTDAQLRNTILFERLGILP